jgi:UDP-N-acetylmuramate--alanine ligase
MSQVIKLIPPIHFIGIGGAGMSGIARICIDRGLAVSGSDAKASTTLAALALQGAKVHVGHDGSHLAEAKTVVISSAIREQNPELIAARERGLQIRTRAQALATLLDGYTSIAVAGTHGKTTTTSMLTITLQGLGMDPSFAIGGTPHDSRANSHHGTGSIFVVEADESDGSFVEYHPDYAIITNVEVDHVDHFADEGAITAAFEALVKTVKTGVILCGDDPGSARLATFARGCGLDTYIYGESDGSDLRISHIHTGSEKSFYRATWQGSVLGEVSLAIPGLHNVHNSAAALAMSLVLKAPASDAIKHLGEFTGVGRRFELRGSARGIQVVDDYAHHPTEVRATIATARLVAKERAGRVIVIFQPHRYSRTAAFGEQFADELKEADYALLLDIYGAGEEPMPGASSAAISSMVKSRGGVSDFEPNMMNAIERAVLFAKANDIILTMGAGDVTSLAPQIISAINERQS